MKGFTRREKVVGVIAVIVHALIVWHVWEVSKKTPRKVTIIDCDGEIIMEHETIPAEKPRQETPKGIII